MAVLNFVTHFALLVLSILNWQHFIIILDHATIKLRYTHPHSYRPKYNLL